MKTENLKSTILKASEFKPAIRDERDPAFRYWADCNSQEIIDSFESFNSGLRYQHHVDQAILFSVVTEIEKLHDALIRAETALQDACLSGNLSRAYLDSTKVSEALSSLENFERRWRKK